MSRLAWEITFGGACWIAAGIVAAACWAAFRREEKRKRESAARLLAEARKAAGPDYVVYTVRDLINDFLRDDWQLWAEEMAPDRPVYDVEEFGL